MKVLLLLVLLISVRCYSLTDAELAKAELTVKVYRESDPPDSCKELGDIKVPRIQVLDKLAHEKMLRRLAAQKGGNAIQVTGTNADEVTASMYKCKAGK